MKFGFLFAVSQLNLPAFLSIDSGLHGSDVKWSNDHNYYI